MKEALNRFRKQVGLAGQEGFGTRDWGDLYLRFAQTLLN